MKEEEWKKIAKHLLYLASDDPEEFKKTLKATAQRLGVTVEEVYAELQENPKEFKKGLVNSAIKKGAKRLLDELGW